MESLGEKLKEVRVGRNYSVDQIALETHISKRYIVALEEEDFSVFPAETYLIGFLRNYTEYLGLDSEEYINLYKNIKMQEQPLPMDELIRGNTRFSPNLIAIFAVCVAILLIGGGFLLAKIFTPARTAAEQTQGSVPAETANVKTGVAHVFKKNAPFNRELKTGDMINIPHRDTLYTVKVLKIGDTVLLQLPDREADLRLGNPLLLDIDTAEDSVITVKLYGIVQDGDNSIATIGLTQDKRADIKTAVSEPVTETNPTEIKPPATTALVEQSVAEPAITESVHTEPVAPQGVASGSGDVLLIADAPQAFSIRFNFKNNCFMHYEMDSQPRVERYFAKSEIPFILESIAQKIKFSVSNAGSVSVVVAGREIPLGPQGQVSSRLIAWVKDETTGKYNLKIIALS